MKKWIKPFTAMLMAVSLIGGLGGATTASAAKSTEKGKIVINGSSALLPLTLQAASEFKKDNPKVKISASAAGSITGPQSVRTWLQEI